MQAVVDDAVHAWRNISQCRSSRISVDGIRDGSQLRLRIGNVTLLCLAAAVEDTIQPEGK
jgi:hypothetical protein